MASKESIKRHLARKRPEQPGEMVYEKRGSRGARLEAYLREVQRPLPDLMAAPPTKREQWLRGILDACEDT